jgi:hypothetical protein
MKVKDIQIFTIIYVLLIILSFYSSISICPFYNLTHLPCPGCGMTRAIQSILTGDFYLALKYHLFSFIIIFIILIVLLSMISKKIYTLLERFIKKEKFIIVFLIFIIIYGIIRILILKLYPEHYKYYFVYFSNKTIYERINEFFK